MHTSNSIFSFSNLWFFQNLQHDRSTCRALGQPVIEISITEINPRGVGLLGHFGERNITGQFWYFNFFPSSSCFGEEQFWDFPIGLALSHFQGGTVKKSTRYKGKIGQRWAQNAQFSKFAQSSLKKDIYMKQVPSSPVLGIVSDKKWSPFLDLGVRSPFFCAPQITENGRFPVKKWDFWCPDPKTETTFCR